MPGDGRAEGFMTMTTLAHQAWIGNSRISWRKLLILQRSALLHAWCSVFPKHDFGAGHLARYPFDTFERACDEAEAGGSRALSPDISHYLGASRRRISESCCATTTFERFEERPDADRV
jgi:hypothetical protein